MSALDIQIGGSHYKTATIQPVQYIEANKLAFLEGCVVKRVTRHDKPTGKGRQDIEKAIHELQLLIEFRYPIAPEIWPEDDSRIDAIGQNGNDGEHYVSMPDMGPREHAGWYCVTCKERHKTYICPVNGDMRYKKTKAGGV